LVTRTILGGICGNKSGRVRGGPRVFVVIVTQIVTQAPHLDSCVSLEL
jgi:hypothetical protein